MKPIEFSPSQTRPCHRAPWIVRTATHATHVLCEIAKPQLNDLRLGLEGKGLGWDGLEGGTGLGVCACVTYSLVAGKVLKSNLQHLAKI